MLNNFCAKSTEPLVEALSAHLLVALPGRILWAEGLGDPAGYRAVPHTNCAFIERLREAGLRDWGFTFHSLWHTFATELFNQRKRPKIIQFVLGHSSITQTMDTISHLLDDVDPDKIGGLDGAFD